MNIGQQTAQIVYSELRRHTCEENVVFNSRNILLLFKTIPSLPLEIFLSRLKHAIKDRLASHAVITFPKSVISLQCFSFGPVCISTAITSGKFASIHFLYSSSFLVISENTENQSNNYKLTCLDSHYSNISLKNIDKGNKQRDKMQRTQREFQWERV